VFFGITVAFCQINPDGSGVSPIRSATNDVSAEVRIIIKLCGEFAEERYGREVGRPSHAYLEPREGAHSDRADALSIALQHVNGDEVAADELIKAARTKALSVVESTEVWAAIETLAQMLYVEGKVKGSTIIRLIGPMVGGQQSPIYVLGADELEPNN
jgi:hypothetical protein